MKINQLFWMIALAVAGTLLIAACAPSPPEAPAVQADQAEAEEHEADDGHTHSPDQHMAGMHNVPEDAAAVPNPVAATDESIEAGEQIFAINCAVCHGQGGLGDGPGAAGLEKPPANLTEAHVQELSDGALFYIVSHGRPDTPMPAWDNVLNEEQRWQVVNYLRTFREGEHHEDEADAEAEHHEDEADAEEEHHEDDEHHEEEEEHHEEEGEHHEED